MDPKGMIARYLGLTTSGELALADAIALVGLRHAVDPEMRKAAKMYSAWCRAHVDALQPAIERYGSVRSADGERLRRVLFRGNRLGNFGLLRDIHDLVTLATSVRGCWSALNQAARESRDLDLVATSRDCHREIIRQIAWLETKLHHSAPQTLTVPSDSTKELVTSIPSLAQVGAVADGAPRALLRRFVPIAPSAGTLALVFAVALGSAIARHVGLRRSAVSPKRVRPRTAVPQSWILRESGWLPIVGLLRGALNRRVACSLSRNT
jgi:hypothetical protein